MKDNLFDKEFTWLDAVKIAMLIVTMFSTWNIVDLITPPVGLAFVRELAAVIFIEGAFLAFEKATSQAKSAKQIDFASKGYYLSLGVIVLFALTSGALEFGGDALLLQPVGEFMGLAMLARDWVMVVALVVVSVWVGGLGVIYRKFSLANPEIVSALETIKLDDEVTQEANAALKTALEKAKPVVSIARAKAHVREQYTGELKPDEIDRLVVDVENHLVTHYGLNSAIPAPADSPFVRKEASASSPLGEADDDGS